MSKSRKKPSYLFQIPTWCTPMSPFPISSFPPTLITSAFFTGKQIKAIMIKVA